MFIEINGKQNKVGTITGESYKTAVFTYDQDYTDPLFLRDIHLLAYAQSI